MKNYLFIFSFVISLMASAQNKTILRISDDIELIKLTDHVYVHTSYGSLTGSQKFGSNGMLVVNNHKALLFDTPISDSLTKILVEWLRDSMNTTVIGFVPNHWHIDCMGGLAYLQRAGIESYANEKTIETAKEKGLPLPEHSFKDSLFLDIDGFVVICRYPGAAHTVDNIVAYIPSEKVLFAGCMVKNMGAPNLGNLADADIKEYPLTLQRALEYIPDAKYIIPGHVHYGGTELIYHTLDLLNPN